MFSRIWIRRSRTTAVLTIGFACLTATDLLLAFAADVFNGHQVILDDQNKIIPWSQPVEKAYDHFLRLRWSFIKTKVPPCPGPPPRSSYPQYYFYCAFRNKHGIWQPDTWMNDVGEKIPNWFESARLYYAYTGDAEVMSIVKKLMDYTLAHGRSPAKFAWLLRRKGRGRSIFASRSIPGASC
jgi:hypothetical protein